MGSAKKTGKGRLDRFYHLAKEQGFRARSAFKLIQLARKFNFLANARSLVDLCGAPGGWSQVAVKTMPVGAKIICVDLAPIKPMRGVTTLQVDITTPQCRTLIRKELGGKNAQVDVVLNDGAPNVGANWAKDAFTQAELTLAALKLATDVLRPGGTFVTKVFRSSDYSALLWVFHQLFDKVEATKPSASRDVSAEIFVVCQNFKAPKELDPKLLDPKHVFMLDEEAEALKTAEGNQKKSLNGLLKEVFARKRKRDGYAEGDEFRVLKLSDFLTHASPAEALISAHRLDIDMPSIASHPSTTEEIRNLCADLKVIGKGDYASLMKWRAKHTPDEPKTEKTVKAAKSEVAVDDELDTLLERKKNEERRDMKRLREKDKKASWRRRMNLGLTGAEEEPDLFSLANMHSKLSGDEMSADEFEEGGMASGDEDLRMAEYQVIDDSDSERLKRMETEIAGDYESRKARQAEIGEAPRKRHKKKLTRRDEVTASWAQEMAQFAEGIEKQAAVANLTRAEVSDDSDNDGSDASDYDALPAATAPKAPAAAADEPATGAEKLKASRFFSNPIFAETDFSGELADADLPDIPLCDKKRRKEKNKQKSGAKKPSDDAEDAEDAEFEVVPTKQPAGLAPPESLDELAHTQALGQLLIHKKSRIAAIESGYNRYSFDDPEGLPAWFKDEEKHFSKATMPLTKELAAAYRAKLKEINARPIRKLAEAEGRKSKRAGIKLDKLRKQASSLAAAEDLQGGSKARAISKSLSKISREEKRKTVYTVISRQGAPSKNVSKERAGKGAKVKVVDRRLKKDRRAEKRKAKRK
jgi:AdoMet-dependent rRNA methyltransferase SPB1